MEYNIILDPHQPRGAQNDRHLPETEDPVAVILVVKPETDLRGGAGTAPGRHDLGVAQHLLEDRIIVLCQKTESEPCGLDKEIGHVRQVMICHFSEKMIH